MNREQIPFMLAAIGAIITDSHLVYTSGRHGSAYVNKDAIYPHVTVIAEMCGGMATAFFRDGIGVEFDLVAGPEKGGIILSTWTAYNSASRWNQGQEILSVYAEKGTVTIPDPTGGGRKCFAETGEFVFRRGQEKLIPGKKVLVVEDVLTTGGTVRKVVEAVRALEGEVVGVAAICNRGAVTAEDVGGVPMLKALMDVTLESWTEKECPLCARGVPVNTDVGKGRDFLARKAAAAGK